MRRAGGGEAGRAGALAAGGRRARSSSARALAMARTLVALAALLLLAAAGADARKSAGARNVEPQIEEVTAKQLDRLLEDKDFVAVFWCKCRAGGIRPPPADRTASPLVLILHETFKTRIGWPTARRGRVSPCRNVCDGARPNGLSLS